MSLEIAKELLKKGMALNDQELIAMANSLIDEQQKKSSKKATKKTVKKTEPKNNSDFVMKKEESATKKTPVNKVKNRVNKFTDNRTEAKSKQEKTPKVKLTPRNRPKYTPVYKNCENCNQKMKVIAGDSAVASYICDNCILGRKRRG